MKNIMLILLIGSAILSIGFSAEILPLLYGLPLIVLLVVISTVLLVLISFLIYRIRNYYHNKIKKLGQKIEIIDVKVLTDLIQRNPIDPNTLSRINGFNVRNGD